MKGRSSNFRLIAELMPDGAGGKRMKTCPRTLGPCLGFGIPPRYEGAGASWALAVAEAAYQVSGSHQLDRVQPAGM